MPSYSREAVSEAVGSVLDSMFGDQAPSGPRSIAVEFSGDGSRIVVGTTLFLNQKKLCLAGTSLVPSKLSM